MPSAALVHSHGPFTRGTDPFNAVHNAVVLEEVPFMDFHAMALNPGWKPMQRGLLDKHHLRKHGPGACYGRGRWAPLQKSVDLLPAAGYNVGVYLRAPMRAPPAGHDGAETRQGGELWKRT